MGILSTVIHGMIDAVDEGKEYQAAPAVCFQRFLIIEPGSIFLLMLSLRKKIPLTRVHYSKQIRQSCHRHLCR